MSHVIARESEKVNRYTDLVMDQASLAKSSRGMIRRKKSRLARKIAKGDVNAIVRVAKDRVNGSLSKEQKSKFCKVMCELKVRIKNKKTDEVIREIVAWAVSAIIGFIDAATGLIVSLLWIIRKKVDRAICKCNFDGSCIEGGCNAA